MRPAAAEAAIKKNITLTGVRLIFERAKRNVEKRRLAFNRGGVLGERERGRGRERERKREQKQTRRPKIENNLKLP